MRIKKFNEGLEILKCLVAKSRELFFKHIQKNATVGIKEVYDKLLTNI